MLELLPLRQNFLLDLTPFKPTELDLINTMQTGVWRQRTLSAEMWGPSWYKKDLHWYAQGQHICLLWHTDLGCTHWRWNHLLQCILDCTKCETLKPPPPNDDRLLEIESTTRWLCAALHKQRDKILAEKAKPGDIQWFPLPLTSFFFSFFFFFFGLLFSVVLCTNLRILTVLLWRRDIS